MQPLWQGLGYVALLRRLTALEQRSLDEHFKYRLAQSLGAIDHHQDGAAAGQNADKFGFNLVGEPLAASSFCGPTATLLYGVGAGRGCLRSVLEYKTGV